jgi:hypothetical protein
MLPCKPGMTGTGHCAQPLVEMESCKLLAQVVLDLQSSQSSDLEL